MPPEALAPAGGTGGPGRKGFRLRRALAALAGSACVGLALYAASPLLHPADAQDGTLRGLQIRVLNISQAAAENRMDGALAALDALEKDLDDAASQGLISLSRYRGIEAAVADVRADITQLAAVSAAGVPAATASDASTPDAPAQPQEPSPAEPEQSTVVPAPSVVQPEPVLPGPVPPDPANEAKGKAKGKAKP
ncbi:hypothetical protein QFZ36_000236 [Pseudarthrobacter siccitolerans]|uniref:Uncharacterized protein n=1 Tax=Pseudarthrobacter siccitolerans TaxID=861266 RepID=A0ABU0PFD4_9MICC|nr:hypothetical protein [Pseudarthrobacter siccitolerans]MDQ0672675.1 hypothetical protein [Pseudarthrobacter siccitolerans]